MFVGTAGESKNEWRSGSDGGGVSGALVFFVDRGSLDARSGSPSSRGRRRLVTERGGSLSGGEVGPRPILGSLSTGQKSWSVSGRLRCREGVTEGVDGLGSVAGRQGRGLCPPAGGGGETEPRRRGSSEDLLIVAAHPEGEKGGGPEWTEGTGSCKDPETRALGSMGREGAGRWAGGIGGARRGSSVDAAKKSLVARGDRCMLH